MSERVELAPAGEAANAFVGSSTRAGEAYRKKMVGKGAKWKGKVSVSDFADNWQDKVSEDAAKQALKSGLDKTSGSDFETKATTKGATNLKTGIAAAKNDYQSGYQAVNVAAAAETTLPAHVPGDSDANIDDRLKPWVKKLEEKSRQRRGISV